MYSADFRAGQGRALHGFRTCYLGGRFCGTRWRIDEIGNRSGHFFCLFSEQLGELIQKPSVMLRQILFNKGVCRQAFDIFEAEFSRRLQPGEELPRPF